jgi:Tfp pilus assembly protein PilF
MTAEPKTPLLIGPEAATKAPPVELPAREAARACLVTAPNYEIEGRVEDAIQLFERARTLDASVAAAATRRLAALYDKAGEFSKSAEQYELALKASPKNADLLNDLGYSHYSRGDWPNAVAVLTRAVEIDPNHKKAWINLGMAQAQLGQFEASFQSFCSAVRPADAHCNVGFVLAVQGKTEEAKAQYRQALTLDPGLRAAKLGLASLEKPPPGSAPVAKSAPLDPAQAAAQVSTVAEIQARMKSETTGEPALLPAPGEKPQTGP